MPEEKIAKAFYVAWEESLHFGVKPVPLKVAQRLRGNLQQWAICHPTLLLEAKAIDKMLVSDDGRWCGPRGEDHERETAWWEFWEAVEVTRVITGSPEAWTEALSRSAVRVLEVEELLGLPGGEEPVWLQADATLEIVAGIR